MGVPDKMKTTAIQVLYLYILKTRYHAFLLLSECKLETWDKCPTKHV